jgi:glycosyltransferase involved in cell wall biosynthesis
MVLFRIPLIKYLVERGFRVTAVCPDGTTAERRALEAAGAGFVPIRQMRRSGIAPVQEMRYLLELVSIFRSIRPSHVFSYFIKPTIYATLAGRLSGVPHRLCLIEGTGYTFTKSDNGNDFKRWVSRTSVSFLFRLSLPFSHHLFVLNREDEEFFVNRKIINRSKLSRVDGIGVDLLDYAFQPPHLEPITFTFAGRLIREKGIHDFVRAAQVLKSQHPNLRFIVLGGLDDNPSALSAAEMDDWQRQGLIEWPGKVADVRPWFAQTSVFVLPSRYGEGLPRTIMEAMAMGRPVITSDYCAGCRDSIKDTVSGFVVSLDDGGALVNAMTRFVERPALIASMGLAAREEAQRRYDLNLANQAFFEQLFRRAA